MGVFAGVTGTLKKGRGGEGKGGGREKGQLRPQGLSLLICKGKKLKGKALGLRLEKGKISSVMKSGEDSRLCRGIA